MKEYAAHAPTPTAMAPPTPPPISNPRRSPPPPEDAEPVTGRPAPCSSTSPYPAWLGGGVGGPAGGRLLDKGRSCASRAGREGLCRSPSPTASSGLGRPKP